MTRPPALPQAPQAEAGESVEDSPEALRAEIAALRRRLIDLEQRLAEREGSGEVRRHGLTVPFHELFDKLPIPIVVYRADGVMVAINKANCDLLRLTPEAVVGGYNILLDPEAVAQGYAADFKRAVSGEVVTMPPTSYDNTRGGLETMEDRTVWSRTTHFSVNDAEGSRYIIEVNLDVTDQMQAEQAVREREALLQSIVDNAPVTIVVRQRDGRYNLVSRLAAELVGMSPQDILGKTDQELFPPELSNHFTTISNEVMVTRQIKRTEEHISSPRGLITLIGVMFPLFDARGNVAGICSISTDMTERRLAEEENRRLQEEMLRVQAIALRAISTPLIPIARGVLVMPLIGDVDQDRSRQVTQALLQGVTTHRAQIAILDVTGVSDAGPEVADGLVQAARAVRLLGAQVVLTGIQPSMAQMLTSMGASLSGIVTRGTLESGFAYAMSVLRGG